MSISQVGRNLFQSGAAAQEKAVSGDVALLRQAVEFNEQAVGKAASEAKTEVLTLSRGQIDRMSLDDIDRYFAGDASQANEAVFEATRVGEAARKNQGWKNAGELALACGVVAVAFPPALLGTLVFGGWAFLQKSRASQQTLESDGGHPAQRALQTSTAVRDTMSQRLEDTPEKRAERGELLQQRRNLVAQLPAGLGLDQAFHTEGEWLRAPGLEPEQPTSDTPDTLDGTPPGQLGSGTN